MGFGGSRPIPLVSSLPKELALSEVCKFRENWGGSYHTKGLSPSLHLTEEVAGDRCLQGPAEVTWAEGPLDGDHTIRYIVLFPGKCLSTANSS